MMIRTDQNSGVTIPIFLSLPAIALLIFSVVCVIQLFRSRAMKPTLDEAAVALIAGLVAAVFAGVVGSITGMIVGAKLLTGEMGEWAFILAPATGLVFAVLAFVFTVRWILCVYSPLDSEVR